MIGHDAESCQGSSVSLHMVGTTRYRIRTGYRTYRKDIRHEEREKELTNAMKYLQNLGLLTNMYRLSKICPEEKSDFFLQCYPRFAFSQSIVMGC